VQTDDLLAARLAAGDDRALADAFDRHATAVFVTALRVIGQADTAQDVVQDVFVELWSHPDRFRPEAGTLGTYLAVRARHRAVDVTRSEVRRVARQQRHSQLEGDQPSPSPFDEVLTAHAAKAVRDAVHRLPDGQRQIVELTYFEGLSCREAAHAVGIPVGTAKSRLRLALAKLGAVLDRQLLELT
jgi:RNA polymerase sigma-70 factor, ECF subfamily